MDSVYNNLVASYLTGSRRNYGVKNVHKKYELKEHYYDIVSLNKKTPLYIISLNDERQEYVINIKDQSLILNDKIEQYADESQQIFSKKSAWSENSSVNARIISDDYDNLPEDFNILVKRLACTQINKGTEYYPDGHGLPDGEYSFQVNVNDNMYKFDYTIMDKAQNVDVMRNLAEILNRSDIGINAGVETSDNNKVYMTFESADTGSSGEPTFTFSDRITKGQLNGIVSYYGLNHINRNPGCAEFMIDDVSRHTLTNKFIMNRSLEVTLNSITEDSVHIGYSHDGSDTFSSVQGILDSFNSLVDTTNNFKKITGEQSKLNREFEVIVKDDLSEIESAGLSYDEEGHLVMERHIAGKAFESGEFQKIMAADGRFMQRLSDKCHVVSLNPMEYINKLVVTYPDYSKQGFNSSYVSSLYSGMIFNYFC